MNILKGLSPFRFVNYLIQITGDLGNYQLSYGLLSSVQTQLPVVPFNMPDLQQPALVAALKHLVFEAGDVKEAQLRELGQILHQILFENATVLQDYTQTAKLFQATSDGVCLCLQLEVPQLAALPWEYLIHDNSFMADSLRYTLIRQLPTTSATKLTDTKRPLKLLIVDAEGTPSDPNRPDWVKNQIKAIKEKLRELTTTNDIKHITTKVASFEQLQQRLADYNPDILHIIAHGAFAADASESGGQISIGGNEIVSAKDFAKVLKQRENLGLVVLCVCNSSMIADATFDAAKLDIYASVAATLLENGIPAVLAMQYEIRQDTAANYMAKFYSKLADGSSLQEAVGAARRALIEKANVEWGVPNLTFQAGLDPELFRLRSKPNAEQLRKSLKMASSDFSKAMETSLNDITRNIRESELNQRDREVLTTQVIEFLQQTEKIHDRLESFILEAGLKASGILEPLPSATSKPSVEEKFLPDNCYDKGRNGYRIEAICHHLLAGGSLGQVDSHFRMAKSQTSLHFGIGRDGAIIQWVREQDTAWANGYVNQPNVQNKWLLTLLRYNVNPNSVTISIGYEGKAGESLTSEQFEAALTLCRHLVTAYAIPTDREHIIPHSDIQGDRSCPGSNFPLDELIRALEEQAQQVMLF